MSCRRNQVTYHEWPWVLSLVVWILPWKKWETEKGIEQWFEQIYNSEKHFHSDGWVSVRWAWEQEHQLGGHGNSPGRSWLTIALNESFCLAFNVHHILALSYLLDPLSIRLFFYRKLSCCVRSITLIFCVPSSRLWVRLSFMA